MKLAFYLLVDHLYFFVSWVCKSYHLKLDFLEFGIIISLWLAQKPFESSVFLFLTVNLRQPYYFSSCYFHFNKEWDLIAWWQYVVYLLVEHLFCFIFNFLISLKCLSINFFLFLTPYIWIIDLLFLFLMLQSESHSSFLVWQCNVIGQHP